MYVKPCGDAHFTLLFSHGNAVDLGQMCSFYYGLGFRLGCNVFSYDYSGYGCSSGKPSEKNLYADIAAALAALRSRYQMSLNRIILYGQSIGEFDFQPRLLLFKSSSNDQVAGVSENLYLKNVCQSLKEFIRVMYKKVCVCCI
ncbi:unnamed protein product [Gongylonema pulchrum]|uniref:Hydrolase_4 domain-containing protein n=1 Tax=Gongylonema pulchrum TaxID=637853 RepID=A0A183DBU9_9BILA|nr:unnamed protein product [Gongylonema pulchrum]